MRPIVGAHHAPRRRRVTAQAGGQEPARPRAHVPAHGALRPADRRAERRAGAGGVDGGGGTCCRNSRDDAVTSASSTRRRARRLAAAAASPISPRNMAGGAVDRAAPTGRARPLPRRRVRRPAARRAVIRARPSRRRADSATSSARSCEERRCGILLVEHDMSLVLQVCAAYIYVLDFGELIEQGPTQRGARESRCPGRVPGRR